MRKGKFTKIENMKKKKVSAAQKGNAQKGKKRFSMNKDPFFDTIDSKRRRKMEEDDEDIPSSDDEGSDKFGDDLAHSDDEQGGKEEKDDVEETAAEKRKRMAETYLQKIRAIAEREREEEEEDENEKERYGKEGERDSLVARILQQEQLEESGRVRRSIASRVQKPDTTKFQVLSKHRQSVTSVALSEDDLKGYSASKDGVIVHWDVDYGKSERYTWPSKEVLKSHGSKDPQGQVNKHSQQVLSLAVSSDGRYLASGGLDRHIHLWDTRTRQHIQAFPGHRGPVSCLTFREGTTELFSGSFDRTIKIWNAEDRSYINTLFGHQSEVLTIDCLRKERVLTVGRDRTMHLWKVPEESQLVFRSPASSLECCCFISNDEFLSGSDDGSVQHWCVLRKKPVHIVKNAHSLLNQNKSEQSENTTLSNGHIENNISGSKTFCSAANSWVASVALCKSSDLAASGAGNGSVHLWEIGSESKGILPLFELPLVGFVNSLAFAKSGKFLVAGVGQEPRLGRWQRIPSARNGVFIHSLDLSC